MYDTLYQLHVLCEEITVEKKSRQLLETDCREIYNYRGNTR